MSLSDCVHYLYRSRNGVGGGGVCVCGGFAGWGRGGDNPHKGPFTTPNALLIPFEDFV